MIDDKDIKEPITLEQIFKAAKEEAEKKKKQEEEEAWAEYEAAQRESKESQYSMD